MEAGGLASPQARPRGRRPDEDERESTSRRGDCLPARNRRAVNPPDRAWLRPLAWAAGILAAAWVLTRSSSLMVLAVVVGIVTFPIYPVVDWLEARAPLAEHGGGSVWMWAVPVVVEAREALAWWRPGVPQG